MIQVVRPGYRVRPGYMKSGQDTGSNARIQGVRLGCRKLGQGIESSARIPKIRPGYS